MTELPLVLLNWLKKPDKLLGDVVPCSPFVVTTLAPFGLAGDRTTSDALRCFISLLAAALAATKPAFVAV